VGAQLDEVVVRHILLLPALLCASCATWFLDRLPKVDRSRPVALVETTAGAELGACTELGVLTLGRAATSGPCRVHYFLGPSPMTDDGTLESTGSVFCRADIDLRTQHLRILERPLQPDDTLVAMFTTDGREAQEVPVQLCREPGIEGDVLHAPATPLPAGAAVLADTREGYRFCGLVSGRAELQGASGTRTLYLFAGVDRVRELLAVPTRHPVEYEPRFRPDDITVLKPAK
jgi:hypothetical protein